MLKRFLRASVLATALCAFVVVGAGCASPELSDTGNAGDSSAIEYSDDSIIAAHEQRGTDLSALEEVSIESCTANGCHGGSWEALVEENEAMWKGIGQISDANPHAAHASNAYECADCHSLGGTSVNQCNGCHVFPSPDSWTDKDKTTATDGPTNDAPVY